MLVGQVVVAAAGLGDIEARLRVLEHRARLVRGEIERLFGVYLDDIYYLAVNGACFDGFCFRYEDGRGSIYYIVENTLGKIVVNVYKGGTCAAIHGIRAAEEFLERIHDIISYARACRDVERELKKLKNILERARELATIYDDPTILEETYREIEAYLEEPRIMG